ncbi:hypothetical protein GCM10022408_27280 [Hymenobacter fastidiosus]|uniref:Uncharacterized protein n=2 Tax=Hymenobacter fastidiosus TaxID=486264 RepID=A0ABP7SKS4_9BACT
MRLIYELRVEEQGATGTSLNSQRGEVVAAAQQVTSLSQTRINLRPADHCQLELQLFDRPDKLLVPDSLLIGSTTQC